MSFFSQRLQTVYITIWCGFPYLYIHKFGYSVFKNSQSLKPEGFQVFHGLVISVAYMFREMTVGAKGDNGTTKLPVHF